MPTDPPTDPAGQNPFSVPDPEHLDEEQLRERMRIYRVLLGRLGSEAPAALRARAHVAAALGELEAETRRREDGAAGGGGLADA